MATDDSGGAVSVVGEALDEVLRLFEGDRSGEVASYIPQLAGADSSLFGLGLVSVDGHRYASGDAAARFSLQSLSKPFVYAMVLADLGPEEVGRWVRTEPSGEAFNAISLDPATGRPANAMINAGAIAVTALVPGADPVRRFERILGGLSRFAGRSLEVDDRVYASEAATAHRNRALAHLLRGAGSLPGDDPTVLDLYLRQCAVEVTVQDVGVMAGTLANGGVNPVTGVEVVPEPVVVQVLSVMTACGMYDGAGSWLVEVGLPAKSGVSGGVLAASPGRFGIGAFSPPLDDVGNSVRGIGALRELSRLFGLHMLHPPPSPPSVLVGMEPGEWSELAGMSVAVGVVAARGGLDVITAERLLHAVDGATPADRGWLVVDLDRAVRAESAAIRLLCAGLGRLAEAGRTGVVVTGGVLAEVAEGWVSRDSRSAAFEWLSQRPENRDEDERDEEEPAQQG